MNSAQIRLQGILPNVHSAAKKRLDRRGETRSCGDILLQYPGVMEFPDTSLQSKMNSVKEALHMSLSDFEDGMKLTIIPGEPAAPAALPDLASSPHSDSCRTDTIAFRLCSDVKSAGDFPSLSIYDDPMIKFNESDVHFELFDLASVYRSCRLIDNIIQVLVSFPCTIEWYLNAVPASVRRPTRRECRVSQ